MEKKPKKLLVLGGGISGLSAAFYARRFGADKGIPIEISLVEKGDRLGGKIQTLHRDGFVIERGPDSFLARKTPIIDLTRELGLEDQLRATNPKAKKTFILHHGRLHAMPPGLVLGIPTQLTPFMKTGLISPFGKARAALDLVLPRRKESSDESLGQFLQRRLGKEVLDHIAEPLLAGIYAGDTHSLSLRSTFPQFHEIERKHRSLILGMMASRKVSAEVQNVPPAFKNSLFLTFKTGLSTLVDALVASLDDVEIKTGHGVARVTKLQGGGCEVVFADGTTVYADGVIMALPAYAAASVLPSIPAVEHLESIPYISVANVVMAFDRTQLHHPLDGSGFVVPRHEGKTITACTWTSSKWLHTTPEGKVLIRCYVGRSGEEQHVHIPDEELLQKVLSDLKEIMGLNAKPLFHEISRWHDSMPQYPVGHLEGIKRMREELAASMPGVYVTGAGLNGVGIPDCIRQGKEAAEQAIAFFGERV